MRILVSHSLTQAATLVEGHNIHLNTCILATLRTCKGQSRCGKKERDRNAYLFLNFIDE